MTMPIRSFLFPVAAVSLLAACPSSSRIPSGAGEGANDADVEAGLPPELESGGPLGPEDAATATFSEAGVGGGVGDAGGADDGGGAAGDAGTEPGSSDAAADAGLGPNGLGYMVGIKTNGEAMGPAKVQGWLG